MSTTPQRPLPKPLINYHSKRLTLGTMIVSGRSKSSLNHEETYRATSR